MKYRDELGATLTAAPPGSLLRLHGVNTDSGSKAAPGELCPCSATRGAVLTASHRVSVATQTLYQLRSRASTRT